MSESSDAVPEWLIGAWAREALSVNGEPVASHSPAIWLQAAPHFGDVRIPLESESNAELAAFAGWSSWGAPRLTFHRELDLDPGPGFDDAGELSLKGDRLVERGEMALNGRVILYEEVWRRQELHDDRYLALDAVSAQSRLVVVGGHAVLLTDSRPRHGFAADYWRRDPDGAWSWQWGTGACPGALPEFSLAASTEIIELPSLRGGCPAASWRVQDRGRVPVRA